MIVHLSNSYVKTLRRLISSGAFRVALLSMICVSSVLADQSAVAQELPSLSTVLMKMIPMFVIVMAIFYMLVISPQKKELDDQRKLLDSLKKGDSVVTTSGFLGRVASIGDDFITLNLEQNAAVKVERHHIARKI
jgi:preprotein translocase subunit YajC